MASKKPITTLVKASLNLARNFKPKLKAALVRNSTSATATTKCKPTPTLKQKLKSRAASHGRSTSKADVKSLVREVKAYHHELRREDLRCSIREALRRLNDLDNWALRRRMHRPGVWNGDGDDDYDGDNTNRVPEHHRHRVDDDDDELLVKYGDCDDEFLVKYDGGDDDLLKRALHDDSRHHESVFQDSYESVDVAGDSHESVGDTLKDTFSVALEALSKIDLSSISDDDFC